MGRRSRMLKHIHKDMTGIEIGAACFPVCAKSDGWNVYIVDYKVKSELVERYKALKEAGEPANLDRIEEVDFVWQDGKLSDIVKGGGVDQVDFILASHVIEHMPCLISFLQSAEELVKEDGIISLAIPDKRREYDFLKSISTTADAIDAYLDKRTRHTARTAFLAYFYECTTHSSGKWSGVPHIRDISFANAFDKAKDLFSKLTGSGNSAYSDFHAWLFTQASFQLILLELKALGYINLELVETPETRGIEFFAYLKKRSPWIGMSQETFVNKRTELIQRMHTENYALPWRGQVGRMVRTARKLVRYLRPSRRPGESWTAQSGCKPMAT